MDVRSVFHGAMTHRTHIHNRALLATQHNTACCHKTNWNSEINMTFNSVTLARTMVLGPKHVGASLMF